MTPELILSLATLIGAVVVTPLLVAWITGRGKAAEAAAALALKERDWKRQDEVAAMVTEAARLVVVENEKVAARDKIMNQKVDTIHTLVNSGMTAAMQSEFDARTNELQMLLENIELKHATGKQSMIDVAEKVVANKSRLAALRVDLDLRQRQQKLIEVQETNARQQETLTTLVSSPSAEPVPIPVKIVSPDPLPVKVEKK